MKLTIKTKHIELEYEDGYSMLEAQARDGIVSLIKTMYEYEAKASPMAIHSAPVIGTVEEIFCKQK